MSPWQPSAPIGTLRLRAAMHSRLRWYFESTGALEVETPALVRHPVSDVHLASVSARACGETRFLHTSPEYAMKRLLAAGSGDIWQATRVWRDGESGRWHSPEFTMIEWYRLGMDHHALMGDVERVVAAALGSRRALAATERLTYAEAVFRHTGLDALAASAQDIAGHLVRTGIDVPSGLVADRDACLDLLMGTVVGPQLGRDHLTFVYDYPASQAALARISGGVASRFELYLDGLELANGFHELADGVEQRARFEADRRARAERGLPDAATDEHLLAALAHGLPDCAGVALGFDRLVMCAVRATHIDEVVAFRFEDS